MSYSIYIGMPDAIENSIEIGAFSKAEHAGLFSIIRELGVKYNWLSEMEDYEEFVNFTNTEVKELIQEIEQLQSKEALQTNALLNCLAAAGEKAMAAGCQIMCVGEIS